MPKVIAYAVMAHDDPDLVRRLASALAGRPVVVHVDAKADIGPFEQIPSIRLVRDRVTVNWGGFSVVEAMLRLYRECLDELGDERDAAVALLSGADFPVRPISEFERYVAEAPWSEHIRAVPLLDGNRLLADRIRRRWFFDALPAGLPGWRRRRNAIVRRLLAWALPRRSLKQYESLTLGVSSQWTLLSRACLEDILPSAHDAAFQRLFVHAFAPDELFLATLVHSGRWGAATQFGGLESRADRETAEFTNFHFVLHFSDPSMPLWLDASHAARVVESGAFFARKVRSRDLAPFLEAIATARSARVT